MNRNKLFRKLCLALKPTPCGGFPCPSGSTVNGSGDISADHVTVCFCVTPDDGRAETQFDGVTLTVDGDSVSWALSGGTTGADNCVTWSVSQSIPSGAVVTFDYDGTWDAPTESVSLSVRNLV